MPHGVPSWYQARRLDPRRRNHRPDALIAAALHLRYVQARAKYFLLSVTMGLTVSLSVCLSVCLPVCLPAYLSA